MQTECQRSKRKYSVVQTSQCAMNPRRTSRKTYTSRTFLFEMRDSGAVFLITSAKTSYKLRPMLGVTPVLYSIAPQIHHEFCRFPGERSKEAPDSGHLPVPAGFAGTVKIDRRIGDSGNEIHTVQILRIRNVTPLAIQKVAAMHSSIPISNPGNMPV